MRIDAIDILLVEDNPGDARLIKEILKDGGLVEERFSLVENLAMALVEIQTHAFDIILLDLNLPDAKNLEALDRVIEVSNNKIPVIVITGLDDEDVGIAAIDCGADDYLLKGEITLVQLSRSIRYAIKRAKMMQLVKLERDRSQIYLDTVNTIIVALDTEGKITIINRKGCRILGYEEAELIGRFWFSTCLPQPQGMEEMYPFFQKIMAGDLTKEYFENPIITRSGEVRHVAWHNSLLHDDQGKIIGGLSAGDDITERKRTEEALRESNELFSIFMAHSPIYSFIKEVSPTEGRVLQASENYQQMIGIAGSSMIGKTMSELFPAGFAAKIIADDWAVVSENKVLTRDEELNGLSYTTIKLPIHHRDKTLLAGFTIDITERKKAEEALRESQECLDFVLKGSQLGFWDWNLETNVVKRNERWAEMLGYTLDEIESTVRNWLDFIHPDDRAIAYQSINDHLEGRTPMHKIEYRMLTKDGQIRWIFDQAQIVKRDVHERPLRMSGTHTDITGHKQAEEEKAILQAQFAQAQKMESVGRLAGGVAHDFNNMLSVILGYAQMALDATELSDPRHEHLQEILIAGVRSANITRQLLAFARKQTIIPQVLDLNETVESMLKMLRRLIGEDINLRWQPASIWPVKIDPSQVDQLLANICVNARDAISGVGKIIIETGTALLNEAYCAEHPGSRPGEYVQLSLSDNGCGIDRETLSQIFEPFFTTKEMGKGTGLGLATVYGIVKQNNGFVQVYSEPGRGTIFKIYLPRHYEEGVQVEEQQEKAIKPGLGETVLVVEDEASILKLTARMLKNLGYTVLTANTPAMAIQLASEHTAVIHLLITDVVMPEMNGRDLSEELLTIHPGLKRLFMSGYTTSAIASQGVLEAGLNFIQKPFSVRDLATKVHAILAEEL